MIILAFAAFATRALWAPGALAGHSAWYDLTRIVVFDAAIRSGDWFPAWSPDFYHGYGSPLFQFYAPLTYYLAEIPVLFGAGFSTALKLTQAFAFLASGLAMFCFAGRHVSRWAACFAAVLYMVAPYRLVDLYVRHALAEHCAFVWLPLIALGTERFVSERSRGGLLLGAAATAGVILTHNITALIALPFCVGAGWTLGAPALAFRFSVRAALPAILGVGLAAFFWWPALAGRALTHGPEALTQGYFDVYRNFVTFARMLSPEWGFGPSDAEAPDAMSVQIGSLHLIAGAGALLVALLWRGGERAGTKRLRWIGVGTVTMGVAVAMCHELSRPVWQALPLLSYVQFPWRFLGLVVFGVAICGAGLLDRIGAHSPRREVAALAAGLIAVLAVYAPFSGEAWFLAVDTRASELVRLRSDLMSAGLAAGRLAPVDSVLNPETVRNSGERATSDDDFLPRGVREKPSEPASEPIAVTHGHVMNVTQPAANRFRAELSLSESGTVELRQFWFPGWKASVDSQPGETVPVGARGLVSCAVPAGEHVVEFHYTSLPQRRSGLLASMLTAVLLGVAMARSRPAPRALPA